MEQNLNVPERLVLLDMLPKSGDYTTLKLVRLLREKLSFNADEYKSFEIQTIQNPNGGIDFRWNSDSGNKGTIMTFNDFEADLIKKELKKLDDVKKLEDRHFTIFEKFIGG